MNIKHLLLIPVLAVSVPAWAETASAPERGDEPLIQPQLDRREVNVPRIRARDFDFTLYAGMLGVESFGASPAYGLRFGYHVSEDFFVEGTYGYASVTDENFRRLGIAVFSAERVTMSHYNLSAGINLFPGEIFIGGNRARAVSLYALCGVGATELDRINNISFNVGLGLRVLPLAGWSLRVELRDHLFDSDLLGANKITNNIELTAGLSAYF